MVSVLKSSNLLSWSCRGTDTEVLVRLTMIVTESEESEYQTYGGWTKWLMMPKLETACPISKWVGKFTKQYNMHNAN